MSKFKVSQEKSESYLVFYDISDEQKLKKVAQELEERGWRLQKSVFHCFFKPGECRKFVQYLFDYLGKDGIVCVIPLYAVNLEKMVKSPEMWWSLSHKELWVV